MVHPQTLAMLFSTLALVLAARMLRDGRFGTWEAIAVAVALDLAALVRNVTIATAFVVLAVIAAAAVARPELRRRALRALAIVAVLTVAVPAPWYVYLQVRYGNALFGRGSGSTVPTSQPYPASFYLSLGLPQVITAPQRNNLGRDFVPVLYADTWGDYSGVWAWGFPPHDEVTPAVNDRLELQSIVGIVPTVVAGAGLIALLGAAWVGFRRRSEALLVPVLPLAVLLASLLYAVRSPAADRDTVKALFLLTGVPAVALCFGAAVDVLWHRARPALLVLAPVLVVCGAISLAFTNRGSRR